MVRVRKYVNTKEDYFENIDTPSKSYILGFIAADGYNTGKGISIGIQNKDEEILRFIRNEICPNRVIKQYKTDLLRLDITSKKLSSDLDKLGIMKNKSKILKFPSIPDNLLSHFIRGFFDGDGSVGYRTYNDGRSKKGIKMNYTSSSICFIKDLKEKLKEKCNLKDRKIHKNSKSECFYLQYYGSNNVRVIFDYIYNNSCFHLTRKYEKFINYYNNNGILSN